MKQRLSLLSWLKCLPVFLSAMLLHVVAAAYPIATLGTAGSTANTSGPTTSTTDGDRVERHSCIYSAAEMTAAGVPANTALLSIAYEKTGTGSYAGSNLTIRVWMKNAGSTTFPANPAFATETGSATLVYETTTGTIPSTTGWITFPFNQGVYVWNGTSNVQVVTEIVRPTDYTGTTFNWRTIASLTNGTANGNGTISAPPATLARTSIRPQVRFELPNTGADGALTAITGLSNAVPGPQTIGVVLRNTGTTTLTSASLDYTINGGTPMSVSWSGSLASGAQTTVTLVTANLPLGFTTVAAGITGVNNTGDVDVTNNSATQTVQICNPLSGAYTINDGAATSGTNFASFTEFASALAACGMNGPVTATVATGSGPYTEQVTFRTIAGLGAAAPLTIEGSNATITSDTAILSGTAPNPNRHIIRLQDLQYVTINNLNVDMVAGSTAFHGFHVLGLANRISITNCDVNMGTGTSVLLAGAVCNNAYTSVLTPGGIVDSLVFSGNAFTGGGYGISVIGADAPALATAVRISSNTFQNHSSNGVYLRETDSAQVFDNTFDEASGASNTFNAIQVAQLANVEAQIYRNQIRMSQANGNLRGIYLFGGSGHRVFNNAIYNVQSASGDISGILLRTAASNPQVYFNTIALDHTAPTTGNLYGIRTETAGTAADIRNNVISISQITSGYKAAIMLNSNTGVTTTFATCDYNLYYVPGGDIAGRINVTTPVTYATALSTWQGLTPYDDNTVNVDPQFASATLPSPTNTAARNTGVAIAGITTDLPGAPRATPPDVGAYEETVPLPSTLLSFSGEAAGGTNRLFWTTAANWDNGGFTVERSGDGARFESVGFVAPVAPAGHRLRYTYTDVLPPTSANYYRLRIASGDGSETFSHVVRLSARAIAGAAPVIYPNPALQTLSVSFAADKTGPAQLLVTDLAGKVVLTHALQAVAGPNVAVVPVAALPAGLYLLRVQCGEGCAGAAQPWEKR